MLFSNCVWAASQQFYGQVMTRLAQAQGGVTFAETVGFGVVPRFLGFPVIPVQKQADKYYVFSKSDWMRTDAQRRAPGAEIATSGTRVN